MGSSGGNAEHNGGGCKMQVQRLRSVLQTLRNEKRKVGPAVRRLRNKVNSVLNQLTQKHQRADQLNKKLADKRQQAENAKSKRQAIEKAKSEKIVQWQGRLEEADSLIAELQQQLVEVALGAGLGGGLY